MPPYSPFSFGGSHIPQPTLIVGGWNLPYYGSNPSFTFPGASSQMGGHSSYYTSPIYPSSAMSVCMNTFPMADPHLSSGVSSGGSHFYSMGNSLHKVPSSRGNIYPHLSNLCHVAFSSQEDSLVKPWSEMLQPTTTTSLVTASHTGIISPTSDSHVGDRSTTYASHVEDQQIVAASHAGGTTLVTASHIAHT
jgi:hypothetical protein